MKLSSRKFAAIPKAISLALAFGFSLLGLQGNVEGQWVQAGLDGYGVNCPPMVSGGILFVATNVGVFLSNNNGTSWTEVNNGLGPHWDNGTAFAVSGSYLFVGTGYPGYGQTGNGVFRSGDDGASWQAANQGLTDTNVTALAVSGSSLFAGTYGGGIFLSTNNGSTWIAASTGLTNTKVYTLAVSGTYIIAGTTNGVFVSTNNGADWIPSSNGLTFTDILSLAVTGTNLFAAPSGAGVFRSSDNGASWQDVSTGLTKTDFFGLVAIGTNIFAGTYGGVFHSGDNGGSWQDANEGLTNSSVQGLAVCGTNLFAGTWGSGVFSRPLSDFNQSTVDTPYHFEIVYDTNALFPVPNSTARITGYLKTQAGAPVPNVSIGIEDPVLKETVPINTANDGSFSYPQTIPSTPAGFYTLGFLDNHSNRSIISIAPKGNMENYFSHQQILSELQSLQASNTVSSVITDADWGSIGGTVSTWQPNYVPVYSISGAVVPSIYDLACLAYANSINNNTSSQPTNLPCYNASKTIVDDYARRHIIDQNLTNSSSTNGVQRISYSYTAALCAAGGEADGIQCVPLLLDVTDAAWGKIVDAIIPLGNFSPCEQINLKNKLMALKPVINIGADIATAEPDPSEIGISNQVANAIERINDFYGDASDGYDLFDKLQVVHDANCNFEYLYVPIKLKSGADIYVNLTSSDIHAIYVQAGEGNMTPNASHGKGAQIQSIDSSSFDLDIYDDSGRHAGRSPINSDSTENGIPGVVHSGVHVTPQTADIIYGQGNYNIVVTRHSGSGDCPITIVNSFGDSVVKTVNETLSSSTSSVTYVAIADTGMLINVAEGVTKSSNENHTSQISCYPNPTSTSETLLYSLADESSVSITIYDLLGRIVARPVVGEMESGGQHETTFDTQGLPNGLYWCRLTGDGIAQSAKMVIAR